jgi:hypothetical protein
MTRIVGLFIILPSIILGSGLAYTADTFILKSEHVDLPTGDRMFTGAGAEVVNDNCLTCHSAGMILNQPPLAKTTWNGIVKKMIDVYKAPVAETDVAPIVEYLSNHPTGKR